MVIFVDRNEGVHSSAPNGMVLKIARLRESISDLKIALCQMFYYLLTMVLAAKVGSGKFSDIM